MVLQLSEFEIISIAPTTVKGQAIADPLAWFPGEEGWNVANEVLGIYKRISTVEVVGAGIVLHCY